MILDSLTGILSGDWQTNTIPNKSGNLINRSFLDSNVVFLTGDQQIYGYKFFNSDLIVSNIGSNINDSRIAVTDSQLIASDIPAVSVDWGSRKLSNDGESISLDWNNNILSGNWSTNQIKINSLVFSGTSGAIPNNPLTPAIYMNVAVNGTGFKMPLFR